MDFASRDHYRHVIEKIAKSSSKSEEEIARLALSISKESAALNGKDDRLLMWDIS
jgi:cyclic beta-1,2-glucan synthetase